MILEYNRAQPWQRDRAKLDTFPINFGPKIMHTIGALGVIKALYLKGLPQSNFVAKFHQENASCTRKTAN